MGDKKQRLKISLLLFAAILVAFVVDSLIRGARAKRRQDFIIRELASIPDPPKANLIRSVSGFKTSNGYAKRMLRSSVPTDDIRQFYAEKFDQQGWASYGSSVRLSKQRAYFCRDDDTAIEELPESTLGESFEYFVEISWGISYGCDSKKNSTQ